MDRTLSIRDYAVKSPHPVPLNFGDVGRLLSLAPAARLSPGNMFWDDTSDLRDFADALPTVPAELYAEMQAFKHS